MFSYQKYVKLYHDYRQHRKNLHHILVALYHQFQMIPIYTYLKYFNDITKKRRTIDNYTLSLLADIPINRS